MRIPKFEAQKEWNAPTEFPDLRSYDEIAVDLETRDPDLKNKGSGSIIGNGEVVGISVAVQNLSWYFPIAHGNGPNMDPCGTPYIISHHILKLSPIFVLCFLAFI